VLRKYFFKKKLKEEELSSLSITHFISTSILNIEDSIDLIVSQHMAAENCTSYWFWDDFTPCARHIYIEQYLYGIFLTIAFLVLLVQVFQCARTKTKYQVKFKPGTEEEPLLNDSSVQPGYLTANQLDEESENDDANKYDVTEWSSDSTGSEHGSAANSKKPEEMSVSQKHFDITRIKPYKEDGTPMGYTKVIFRDQTERLKVAFDEILVLAHVGLQLTPFFDSKVAVEWEKYPYTVYFGLAYWVFILILTSVRLANVSCGVSPKLPDLWWFTFVLYLMDWLPSTVLFRSALLNHTANGHARLFYIVQYALDTLLALNSGSCRFSDRPTVLLEEEGIDPSPEVKSPFFSIATYSWIDRMIFVANKRAISMKDVWGLRFDDYAYPVLMKYHKNLKYHRFMYDLFNQFKLYLFCQACLTSAEAFIVFVPSLLLKKILEYVDAPDVVPSSMAWLYVLLMLMSGVITSITDGRGLFLGRRVCTRMKAIIIGEIYAKALRRRLTADNDEEVDDGNKKKEKVQGKEAQKTNGEPEKDPSVMKSRDTGSIINLMAVDAFKVSGICGYLHYFVNSLVMTFFAVYLLYNLMGWPALMGSLTIIFLLPINYHLSMRLGKYQNDMLKITDKRIQKLNETFQSIRIIKFFSWESKFEDDIMDIREDELRCLRNRCIAWVVASFVWMVTPTIVCLIAFYCYTVVMDRRLTTPIAFTALSLFNLLRAPLDQFADMLSNVVQAKVSLDRIEAFLNEPESSKYEQLSLKRGPNSPVVGFENATFSWSSHSKNDFKLRDINVDFKLGKLNVVIGPTGSGKSSLLLALLGEMDLVKGKVFLPGSTPRSELTLNPVTGLTESVAYCSQTPWLLNGTVRENILFSSPYSKERYLAVIEACGLKRDLEILQGGDETEVGEKGVTLSGGQKQRVSLARALYSEAAYVLLDDCLSAVDSHTAVYIYEQCITGKLMKNRTCILISHNISLTVREAAWVVAMENGRVRTQGTVDQLMDDNEFDDETVSSVMASRSNSSANLSAMGEMNPGILRSPTQHHALVNKVSALAVGKRAAISDLTSHHEEQFDEGGEVDEEEQQSFCSDEGVGEENAEDERNIEAGRLIKEETKSDGAVSLSVYKAYFRFFGTRKMWALLFFAFIGSQVVYVLQSYWLRIWSMAESERAEITMTTMFRTALAATTGRSVRLLQSMDWHRPLIHTALSEKVYGASKIHSSMFYIAVYTLIGSIYSALGSLRIIITFFCNIRVSRKMFKLLLDRVLRAKLRFFDSTPQGRLMNRFSKDIEGVDQELGPVTEGAVVMMISCISTIVVITLITPAFVLFAIVILILYTRVGSYYLNLSRDLKRYESITRSPIHQHFTETLNGVATIRAYCDESRFMIQNMEKIDTNNRPFFYVWLNNRWLAMRADIIGSAVSFLSAALAVAAARNIDSGMAGISLSFAVTFNDSALWLLRTYAEVEINMNSVERIQEYIERTEQEPDAHTDHDPPASWPQNGEIEVHDLSIRYAPQLPRVIDQISFNVRAAEKIGIVGRTGAGKSTIIQSFFRFVDPDSGYIKIDGIDICSIGLAPLRRGLTIIPQDPTLFAGTLRSNLDIYNEYSDMEMFESLHRVNLISNKEHNKLMNGGMNRILSVPTTAPNGNGEEDHENTNKFLDLDSEISEGGLNLSQGERQLVCLARALLKSPKILMLDEATASIDYESDAKLQKTIRDEFSTSTIITIAHRLKTIIDYDRILVLDAGGVKEFDSPYALIQNQDSQFRSMCLDTGEFDELARIAKEAFIAFKAKAKHN